MNKFALYANTVKDDITDRIGKENIMTISDIRIRRVMQEGRLRAVVSITIDNAIAVHDIRLVQGDDRMFVAMPSRRDDEGKFRDIIHPIHPEVRNEIEERIIAAYNSAQGIYS